MAAMSLALGLSFGITGSRVPRRTTSVARAAMSGSQPNSIPPSATFGQEMFTSMADTPSAWSRIFDSSPYSSSELPQMFAITIFPRARTAGSFSARKRRMPTSWRPIAFSMPDGVSQIRGGGHPSRGSR